MIREEIILMLGWLKAQDPRIQQNDPAVDGWEAALRPFSAHEVRKVLERHIITNPEPPRPADIRRATTAYVEYQRARQSAIEPPKRVKHPSAWRSRNPELWDQLFAQGRREGNAVRARHTAARKES